MASGQCHSCSIHSARNNCWSGICISIHRLRCSVRLTHYYRAPSRLKWSYPHPPLPQLQTFTNQQPPPQLHPFTSHTTRPSSPITTAGATTTHQSSRGTRSPAIWATPNFDWWMLKFSTSLSFLWISPRPTGSCLRKCIPGGSGTSFPPFVRAAAGPMPTRFYSSPQSLSSGASICSCIVWPSLLACPRLRLLSSRFWGARQCRRQWPGRFTIALPGLIRRGRALSWSSSGTRRASPESHISYFEFHVVVE